VTAPPSSSVAIRFEKIEKRFGGLYALRRISFDVSSGECVALAGRNGSGKTTLLRIAAQLVRPSSGKVVFPAAADHPQSKRSKIGFVAHATMVYDELTARENLLLFARLQEIEKPTERVELLLREAGLEDRANSLVRTFSRGMRQRVALARALLHHPNLLLLDEPATGLDLHAAAWLARTLVRLRDSGCTILMSLHGESEISTLASRGIRLEAGSIVEDTREGGSLRSILTFAGG
jgi:heme ABC exporter ATP-binding subunit CcmA